MVVLDHIQHGRGQHAAEGHPERHPDLRSPDALPEGSYALDGANPINFVDVDGHKEIDDDSFSFITT